MGSPVKIVIEGGEDGTGYFVDARYQLFTSLRLEDGHRFILVHREETLGRFRINPVSLQIPTPGANTSYLLVPASLEE